MGSFGGHALPGSFFIVVGVYWTVQFYRKLFESMRPGGAPFVATVTFRCDRCCEDNDNVDDDGCADVESSSKPRLSARRRRGPRGCRCCSRRCSAVDWEGVAKIFFATVGFIVEVTAAMIWTGRFTAIGNGQHATMFFFFGLSGVVDLLVRAGSPLLPVGSEYLFGALAFIVEALLFAFHTHGRAPLDVLVHTLLVYVLCATIIVVFIEARFRRVPIVVFTRAYLLIVQGTWFWQVGFILYRPLPGSAPWDPNDHNSLMVVTLMFVWHLFGVMTLMIGIGAAVHATCYRRVGRPPTDYVDSDAATRRSRCDDVTSGGGRYTGDDCVQLLSMKRPENNHNTHGGIDDEYAGSYELGGDFDDGVMDHRQ